MLILSWPQKAFFAFWLSFKVFFSKKVASHVLEKQFGGIKTTYQSWVQHLMPSCKPKDYSIIDFWKHVSTHETHYNILQNAKHLFKNNNYSQNVFKKQYKYSLFHVSQMKFIPVQVHTCEYNPHMSTNLKSNWYFQPSTKKFSKWFSRQPSKPFVLKPH